MIADLIHVAGFVLGLSPIGFGISTAGALMVALAIFSVSILPSAIVRPVIGAGLLALSIGATYVVADARAMHRSEIAQAAAAKKAEASRAAAAEAIARDQADQALRDAAALADSNRKLKEFTDALAKDPDRDRVCGTRDDARRLRSLRGPGTY